jgi:hypothetical protein
MMYLKGVSMVSKAVMMVLFLSMVLAEEGSGLSQRLNAIDAQEQEMLSLFEKIKKEQEAKEEQQSDETVQNEENTTFSPEPSVEEKTVTVSQIESEQRDETAQHETTKSGTKAEATSDNKTIQKTKEPVPEEAKENTLSSQAIQSKPTAAKSKKHSIKKYSTKKMKSKKHTKKRVKKSVKKKQPPAAKTEPASAAMIPSTEPAPKKRTALEHLESVLNPK